MVDAKTAWGTVAGTDSASIDIVLMEATRPLTNHEILAEVRRRGLPARQHANPHLSTLKRRGFITNKAGKWFKVSTAARQEASLHPSAHSLPSSRAISTPPTPEQADESFAEGRQLLRQEAAVAGALMRVQIELCVDFGQPVRLSEIDAHKQSLLVHGVYIIAEGGPKGKTIDPTLEEVVYIGKAIKQTVHGRCVRHVQSVKDARSRSGKPLSEPGFSFKSYRERINRDPSRLWVTPGVMCVDIPYAISCAEEYLLHQYRLLHGRYPWCNSAGQEKDA